MKTTRLAWALFALSACQDPVPAPDAFEASCERTLAAVSSDDGSVLRDPPARSLAGRGTELVVIAPMELRAAPDVDRLLSQIEGWGHMPRILLPQDVSDDSLARAGSIVVASSAYTDIGLSADAIDVLERAIESGTDVLWLGLGVPSELEDELGASVSTPLPAMQHGVASVPWAPPGAQPLSIAIDPAEWVQPLAPQGGEVLAAFDDGRALLITNRVSPSSGRATALGWSFGDFWVETGDAFAWIRTELVDEALRNATSNGSAVIELAPAGTQAIVMVRFEDIHPGGRRFMLSNPFFLERFDRVIDFLGDFGYHINLSIVPRFVHPRFEENNGWLDPDEGRAQLLASIRAAIEGGAALIAHGYTHQYGDRDTDYTGIDFEFSDDSNGAWAYLPYDEQSQRIEASRAELEQVFGFAPRIWETPHLDGNDDTYLAASEHGFDVVTEQDSMMFPHVLAPSTAINVPHTGSFIPTLDGAEPWTLDALEHVMPRMFRMRAPFFFFYHGYDDWQEAALHTACACAAEAGAWGPTVDELADRWSAIRTSQTTLTHTDERTMRFEVHRAPADAVVTLRVPEGHRPIAARVDGVTHSFEEIHRSGAAFARIELDDIDAIIEIEHAP
jgi:hypothetical protein